MSEATERAWVEVQERLRGFIGRRVDDPLDAEDVLHEVWLRLQRSAGALQEQSIPAWLFRVTRNAIADHHRARVRQGALRERLRAEGDGDEGGGRVMGEVDPGEVRSALASCLTPLVETLPGHYREAVVLSEIEGLTQAEVAGRLGLSVSGVKSRVQRGRRLLRERLLDCCQVEVDGRGALVGYERKGAGCGCGGQGHAASSGRTDVATNGCGCG